MAQLAWHDGSVKHVHVDPAQLEDYQVSQRIEFCRSIISVHVFLIWQQKLDECIDFYKRRLDWLCSGSRRVFGAIVEKRCVVPNHWRASLRDLCCVNARVVILCDTSFASLEQLSRFQEHVRLLLEEQLPVVESFNLIRFVGGFD